MYFELSQIKNGKSFTQVIKNLLEQCENKGDPKKSLDFLNTHGPLSEESASRITVEMEEGRKRSYPRKSSFE